jgi:aspartate kinase
VLYGQRHDVPIHVRHSGRDEDGTMVIKETPEMERVSVVGCALTPDLGRITVRHLPNRPGVQSKLFEHIAAADILVDDIIQVEDEQTADVSFTVNGPQLSDLKLAVASALEELGAGVMSVAVGLAKVSAVGVGMRPHTGVAATMFAALGDAGIRIANITTSEIKISCIVPREHGEEGLRVVHEAFGLSGALLARAGEKAEVRV